MFSFAEEAYPRSGLLPEEPGSDEIMPSPAPVPGSYPTAGRIHAVTVNLQPCSSLRDLIGEVEAALSDVEDLDLIVLPESCLGVGSDMAEAVDGPAIVALSDIARRLGSYLVAGLYLTHDDGSFVSSVLIDRAGNVAGVYDKRYPYWSDVDNGPLTRSGSAVARWQTDFGTVGSAICFDVNFHQVWADLADAGVDIVIWPSAYAGGEILRSYAQIHHFHVLTCTQAGDSRLYDPVGAEIAPDELARDPRVRRFSIDLDRGFYHQNFNLEGLERLLADHGEDVQLDAMFTSEQWFVLSRRRDGVGVRGLARSYGLEEIRDYVRRSREAMDALRVGAQTRSDGTDLEGRP
jgi:predicted amidohydrolase